MLEETLNSTSDNSSISFLHCHDQLFLPAWLPQNVTQGTVAFRGSTYFFCMCYLFLGVSIAADKFMGSIQMITSKKKQVQIKDDKGETRTVVVHLWNETVANLTLMAMGCSAPEILLAIIEVVGKNFEADELGPGVAVGSAAINLFLVIGICNLSIPFGQFRRIKRVSVFLVNAIWSLFSYCWLLIILKWSSPGEVEVWEGLVTLSLFPVTVLSAYLADRHVAIYDYLSKSYGMGRHGVIVEMTADDTDVVEADFAFKEFEEERSDEQVRDFEGRRRAFLLSMKNLRKTHSFENPSQLELMATKELFKRGTQSKAFYKELSTMMLSEMCDEDCVKSEFELHSSCEEIPEERTSSSKRKDSNICKVFFRPGHFTVMENVGEFTAKVVREGGDLNQQVLVDYATEDGGALAHRDYVPLNGTLVFEPGEAVKIITVKIVDDKVYEGDQLFYIRLFNIRVNNFRENKFVRGDIAEDAYQMESKVSKRKLRATHLKSEKEGNELHIDENYLFPPRSQESPRTSFSSGDEMETEEFPGYAGLPSIFVIDVDEIDRPRTNPKIPPHKNACLVFPSLATVMILDDDHQGIFGLTDRTIIINESVGTCNIRIVRCVGSRGRVAIPYCTEEGTAQPTRDYIHTTGEVIFEDGEIEKTVSLIITANVSYQKDAFFYFTLGEPRRILVEDEHDTDHYLRELTSRNIITDRQRNTMLGRPKLSETYRTVIRLQENKAFQSTVDKMLKRTNLKLKRGYSAWAQQFLDLFTIETSEENENPDENRASRFLNYVMHILKFPWNCVAAFIPPESLLSGYPTFFASVLVLGLLSSFLGDCASLFGCTLGLDDSVTAVGIVAFGTTVPDLLVSRFAAVKDKHADAAINNVTGAKSLNVYFGIGLAWSAAAIYHSWNGDKFYVDPGELAFGVTLYVGLGTLAIIILLLKRIPANEGELGGSLKYRIPMTIVYIGCWVTYVALYCLHVYGYIEGF